MDNCSTHLVPGVQELCDEAGVVIRYLLPYSPDFNPIGELFSVAKAWMKATLRDGAYYVLPVVHICSYCRHQ